MNVLKRIGGILVGLLLLSYLVYHTAVVPYTSVKTEAALSASAKETISVTKSYVIRNENPVTSDSKGVYSYALENGSKVANGGTIATVYASETAARSKQKIDALERQIANLETLQGMSSNIVVSLEQLDKQLRAGFLTALNEADTGDLSTLTENSDTYLTLLNRRMAVTDGSTDFSQLLASLISQRDALLTSVGNPTASVVAPCSGYFVSSVDGYESVLTPETVDTLTPESFDKIQADTTVQNSSMIGKVVSDMEWYLAAKVSFDDALLLTEGAELTLDIPTSTVGELPVTLSKIIKSATGEEAVLVFSCCYMSAELSTLRNPAFQIVLKHYEGLRVRTDAIHVEDGKKGVFVVVGSVVRFVPVQILYNGNGYKVCKRIDPLEEGLHLYDDIVVKGKNLYDGKPV